MIWLFWASILFFVYTLAGYPLLVWLLSAFTRRRHRRGSITPLISIIIPVHNEERIIEQKLENTLAQTYPADKREIIVVSDGSEDASVEIVRSFIGRGVKLIETPTRLGKHHGQMLARDASTGEILIFTDASVMLQTDSVARLVSNFADPQVGCVSSQDEVESGKKQWFGEAAYVRFEMWLRQMECRLGSMVSASGSLFAARREVCGDWHVHQSSDFFIPLHAAERNLRVVVDPTCAARYGITRSSTAEFHRKVRTVVHGLDVVFTHRQLLNPFRFGLFSWQLFSHKLCRWLLPFALLGLLVSSIGLWNHGPLMRLLVTGQLAGYALGAMALKSVRLSSIKPLRFAAFFLVGNTATCMAWIRLCTGEKYAVWQPTHRP